MTSVSPVGPPLAAASRARAPAGARWPYAAGCALGLAVAAYSIATAERLGATSATLTVAAALIVAGLAAIAFVLSLRSSSAGPSASVLTQAFAAGPEPWFVTGPQATVVEANGAARSFLAGRHFEIGAPLATLFPDHAAGPVEALHGRAICGEAAGDIVDFAERGGAQRVTCAPVPGRRGFLLWTLTPAPATAPARPADAQRWDALEGLVHRAPLGLFAATASGRFTFVNETLAAWLGVPRAALEDGANLLDFVDVEDAPPAAGLPSGAVRLRGAVGASFAATVSLGGDTEEGPVVGLIANHVQGPAGPIGDRRRPGSRRFFDAAPIGFVRLDGGGHIVESNDAFRVLAGAAAEVEGAALADLILDSAQIGLAARLALARGGGGA